MHPSHHKNFSDIEPNYTKYLPDNKQAAFLDIGCGSGRIITWLNNKGYKNILGIDISDEALTNVPHEFKNKTKRIDRLDQFLVENRHAYDFIFAKDVIYYFSKDELIPMMEKIRDSLKPDGTLMVEIFNGSAQMGPYVKYKDYRIQWIFTEHSLLEVLKDSGFEIVALDRVKVCSLGIRSILTSLLGFIWRLNLRVVYWAERGVDAQNPKFLHKKIYAIAKAKKTT